MIGVLVPNIPAAGIHPPYVHRLSEVSAMLSDSLCIHWQGIHVQAYKAQAQRSPKMNQKQAPTAWGRGGFVARLEVHNSFRIVKRRQVLTM
jgi:hypothetical protein